MPQGESGSVHKRLKSSFVVVGVFVLALGASEGLRKS